MFFKSDLMKNIVIAVTILIVLIVAIFIFTSESNKTDNADILIPSPSTLEEVQSPDLTVFDLNQQNQQLPFKILKGSEIEGKLVRLKTDKGDIVILMSPQTPIASSNFLELVGKGFYDGLTFHRREEDFVIQGGDPRGDGSGGPGYKFPDEKVIGAYARGVVAMANAGPNTNGSQFFIVLKDAPGLPKAYTIFGVVKGGMDIVDQIQVGDKITKAVIE